MGYIVLADYFPSPCLLPFPADGQPKPRGRFTVVEIGGQKWLMAERLMRQAARYGADRIYNAGLRLSPLFKQDQDIFFRNGFADPFLATFTSNNERMYQGFLAQRNLAGQGIVERQLLLGNDDEALGLVRGVVKRADSLGIRDVFGKRALRFPSYEDRYHAVQIVANRAQLPLVRERLRQAGVTDEMLGKLDALHKKLHENRGKRAGDRTQALQDSPQLQAGKALVLGTILLVSKVGLTEVPAERAPHYQLRSLLKTTGRTRRGKKDAAAVTAPAQPAPAPGHGVAHPADPKKAPAGHGKAAPLHGAQGLPPGAMPMKDAPGTFQPAAGPATGTTGTAAAGAAALPPPATAAPASATASAGTAEVHAAPPALVPGTVIATLPVEGGPPLQAVVQLDGKPRWVPAPPAPPTPRRHGRHGPRTGHQR